MVLRMNADLGDFIADLNHVGHGVVLAQIFENRCRLVMHFADQRVELETFPRFWLGLLSGIGPAIGVMEIEKELRAAGPDALSQRPDGRQILRRPAGINAADQAS